MNAELPVQQGTRPRWRRQLGVAFRRNRLAPLELLTALVLIATIVLSIAIVTDRAAAETLLTPPLVAGLLVANLVPAVALMVLVARRVAMGRALQSGVGARGRLHVRLVAIFSVLASVPTLLVVIFASLLFQSGTDFWFSDRARNLLENSSNIARQGYADELERVRSETVTTANDLARYLPGISYDDPVYVDYLIRQLYVRNLSDAVVLQVNDRGEVQSLVLVNPYERAMDQIVQPEVLRQISSRQPAVVIQGTDRIATVAAYPGQQRTYLYASRVLDPRLRAQIDRAGAVVADYRALTERSRDLQLRFNAVLLVVSLLIVAVAIWIALNVADRLVRPVGELVGAARRVTAGDLSARVPHAKARDEVGTLGHAFNRMTGRLQEQTGALVAANARADSRRAFIEAVLSGVTAGVISVDGERNIRLINSSAEALLDTGGKSPVGRKLAELAPELDRQIDAEEREEVVQLTTAAEPRTLAVKTVKVDQGHVLTFDDITEQVLDQRRAAWSDVARRIAHEIKNPLTPIQLAAERLQRRYGAEVQSDPATFERLTGTIVRQVGDLRRMVDEFSSFARMPKPVFADEPIAEIARQAVFLHEVAHPDIQFSVSLPDSSPRLVCDRRLLGQALTNIVKNAVEAIQQKREERGSEGGQDMVALAVDETGGCLSIRVSDTGIGLPAERARITEPYMTTRAKGTGLGLAIVKKIVEEHCGTIAFADRTGGGTEVRLTFDTDMLRRLGSGGALEHRMIG